MKKRIKNDTNVHLRRVATCTHTHTHIKWERKAKLKVEYNLDMNGGNWKSLIVCVCVCVVHGGTLRMEPSCVLGSLARIHVTHTSSYVLCNFVMTVLTAGLFSSMGLSRNLVFKDPAD